MRASIAVARLCARFAVALTLSVLVAAGPALGDENRIPLNGALALVDADGKAVTTDDFAGKWLVIYFGYTHCVDLCPTALSSLAEALDELGPAAEHVQPIFVTVDPERDRGTVLRDFAASFDKRLIGLGGSPEQITAAATALGIEYRKVLTGDDDYVVDHSTTLSVIDPARRSAVTFASAEPYQIAAKLFELLDHAGVALGGVNNLHAYR